MLEGIQDRVGRMGDYRGASFLSNVGKLIDEEI